MKLVIKYWPMLLVLVLFICVIRFLMLVQKTENTCLSELKNYCNKLERDEVDFFRKILVKNIGYYFVLYIIASMIIGIFVFLFLGEIMKNFLPICCMFIIISYISTIFPLINIIKKRTSAFYKVNVEDVETIIKYRKSDSSDNSRSCIKYYFYIKNKKEQYCTENAILIFNKLIDRFILKKSCLGECYILDDKLLVKIKKDK